MSFRRSLLFIAALIFTCASGAGAATIQAASCSQTDVQTAINKAVTGDVVALPAGSCTWTATYAWQAPVYINNMQKIAIQGAGMDSTIITRSPQGAALSLNLSGSSVANMQFVEGYIRPDGDGWRIHHCRFSSSTGYVGVQVFGTRENLHPTGLIDHCIFTNMTVGIAGGPTMMAHGIWAKPLNLGTGDNVVYVEDNVFNGPLYGNSVDGNYGARYVVRYNTINDMWIEAHSVQGANRSIRSWEIYNNTFNQRNRALWVPFRLRGGTGVVFNNTVTGIWTQPSIVIDNVRSGTVGNFGTEPGFCNGNSAWDGNTASLSGYPCRDQIGRSTDQWLWTTTTPYPPQSLDPAYSWNNKYGAQNVIFSVYGDGINNTHIKEGRDYFNNAQKPGYIPYTYPHPLQSGGTVSITPSISTTGTAPTPTTTTTTTTPTGTTITDSTAKMIKVLKNGKVVYVQRINR